MDTASTPQPVLAAFAALVGVGIATAMCVGFRLGRGSELLLALAAILVALSAVLIVLTLRADLHGPRRWFLLATGISALAFPVAVALHNVAYALGIAIFGAGFWERIGMPDEAIFFVIAIFVCPAVFAVGVVGTVVTHLAPLLRR
ncbi:hypothetical protein HN371_02550 [Candidatus Poribacteria bacterium]|nr:hypothetical protein [Candidatus Poribacteria bacterium]MBT5536901.1 hypothetical protein [Candidatus Poribacteria bacterium]MBT5710217.1 hypothetical protein [Candidatus Poribacteria bacterium]MBT7101499.1 hypothetical protein [Candidatus Poribacteria bacterium]MBT7806543.1 hypothetical protein [Candidatus Poribacteria bacterium]